ncbi:MAG: Holliday junction branch migration protein RuvA, partial [bacterium]|nr:Holliday junction branch migration protein RuvA [bacterium]
MIGALIGTVRTLHKNPVLVMVGGVGYLVHIPESFAERLSTGKEYEFYTHTHVREDSLELYGFENPEDLHLFELLLDVSGIGPRTALQVSGKGRKNVQTAITIGDIEFFTGIPRLGRKNAQ